MHQISYWYLVANLFTCQSPGAGNNLVKFDVNFKVLSVNHSETKIHGCWPKEKTTTTYTRRQGWKKPLKVGPHDARDSKPSHELPLKFCTSRCKLWVGEETQDATIKCLVEARQPNKTEVPPVAGQTRSRNFHLPFPRAFPFCTGGRVWRFCSQQRPLHRLLDQQHAHGRWREGAQQLARLKTRLPVAFSTRRQPRKTGARWPRVRNREEEPVSPTLPCPLIYLHIPDSPPRLLSHLSDEVHLYKSLPFASPLCSFTLPGCLIKSANHTHQTHSL